MPACFCSPSLQQQDCCKHAHAEYAHAEHDTNATHTSPPQTFWHSSAHVLGEALEMEFGVDLTIGPALEEGFYYDCYMGDKVRGGGGLVGGDGGGGGGAAVAPV
jgi:hypothetical protein